jgi:hypothetical protein
MRAFLLASPTAATLGFGAAAACRARGFADPVCRPLGPKRRERYGSSGCVNNGRRACWCRISGLALHSIAASAPSPAIRLNWRPTNQDRLDVAELPSPRELSPVITAAPRPNWLSLTIRIASASPFAEITAATGPNTSSLYAGCLGSTFDRRSLDTMRQVASALRHLRYRRSETEARGRPMPQDPPYGSSSLANRLGLSNRPGQYQTMSPPPSTNAAVRRSPRSPTSRIRSCRLSITLGHEPIKRIPFGFEA